jgi:SET domain-containing protein
MSKKRTIITDISNGLEKTIVTCPDKQLARLESKFKFREKYRIESFLDNTDIDNYLIDTCCDCEDGNCDPQTCECITSHLQKYECNSHCTCNPQTCNNRIVQLGLIKKLEIFLIGKEKGFGVKTLEYIKKDEFVCEYIGQIINKAAAQEKICKNFITKKPNYVLQVRENYEKLIINTFIDAEQYGNVSRFLNHSCDPNLYFDIVRIEHYIPHVAFYALRDIEVDEELTFSYCDRDMIRKDDSFKVSYKKCLCGSERCIKNLPS